MRNSAKWIIIALLLVVIIAGATVLYNRLTQEFDGGSLTSATQDTEVSSQLSNSAPDFTVTDKDGKEVRLSDYKGKPVVINFWATWCFYCKEEMPDFNKAYKAYPDVQFLMVNATDGVSETVEKASEYIEENGFEFDVVYDTERSAVHAYYITGYPATFFIDKDGNMVTWASGMIDYETLEAGIEMIR